ncbi:MAG: SgcJ/EcaC family oxidoreductase [Ignavibacteriales bacterium]|nr:MAG: SgcJ/EcaC family oxidoreductase [Ignavibacteriales bacterium]
MKAGHIKLLGIIFCLAFYTGISYSQDSDLKAKIQQMNDKMIEDMMNENDEAMLALYTDDAISLPSYQPMLKGKAAIMESHKKDKESGFKMNDMTLTTMEVWSSGDLAYEIGTYTIDFSMPGMEDMKDNGKYLTVWQKQSDGSWKVKADTWNTDNNPWMDMEMPSGEMDGE